MATRTGSQYTDKRSKRYDNISKVIGTDDRNDYYTFFLDETSQITRGLSGLEQAAQLSLIADFDNDGVWDSGEEIANDGISDFSSSTADRKITRTLGAGMYWLDVWTNYSQYNTDYTLEISATATPPTTIEDPGDIATARWVRTWPLPEIVLTALATAIWRLCVSPVGEDLGLNAAK